MEVTIKTDQLKILEDFFRDLSYTDQDKIFRAGFRKAAKPLIEAARATVPKRTGALMGSIGSVDLPQIPVAILIGTRGGRYGGRHGHLIENGTRERFRKTKGNAPTGHVMGVHFFEKAYNATEEQVFGAIEKEWYNAIDQFIIRTNKRIKK